MEMVIRTDMEMDGEMEIKMTIVMEMEMAMVMDSLRYDKTQLFYESLLAHYNGQPLLLRGTLLFRPSSRRCHSSISLARCFT